MKFFLVLFSLLCSSITADVVPLPGNFSSSNLKLKQNAEGRIINGNVATPGQFPFQVLLKFGSTICGGSLISIRYVLTVAHCTQNVNFGHAILGAHNQNSNFEIHRQKITVLVYDIIIHEDFNPVTMENDIALVKLRISAQLNAYVQYIDLVRRGIVVPKKIRVIGWGASRFRGEPSDVLRYGDVEKVPNLDCLPFYPPNIITPKHMCTMPTNNQSVCNGDSGGPVVYLDHITNRYTLVGTVSLGSPRGCEAGDPDIHTDISYYLDWIENHMQN